MAHSFDDEAWRGLGTVEAERSLSSLLFDESPTGKRYNRSVTIQMSDEMYQAAQDLIANRNLPFNGSMAMFGRHAVALTTESLEQFLDRDGRALFRSMMQQQRRLTRERVIVTIDELVESQVELLRFWSAKAKWNMVAKEIAAFLQEVEGYPEVEWREHASQVWLRSTGVKALLRQWGEVMKEDAPKTWREVVKLQSRFERMAGAE